MENIDISVVMWSLVWVQLLVVFLLQYYKRNIFLLTLLVGIPLSMPIIYLTL